MSIAPAVTIVMAAMRKHGVRALLMGGQACIAYGASEFTRDIDLAILADDASLAALTAAVGELQAEQIAVPRLDRSLLDAGHAVHFRCRALGVEGIRVDVMSRMRGVDSFERLWERRAVLANGIEVLSLADLVKAKKTQRDKDWPMLRRLLEVDYFARRDRCTDQDVMFWLKESRTPSILIELAKAFPELAGGVDRAAIRTVMEGSAAKQSQGTTESPGAIEAFTEARIIEALRSEEERERDADRAYWAPLRAQLEELRRDRPRGTDGGSAPAP